MIFFQSRKKSLVKIAGRALRRFLCIVFHKETLEVEPEQKNSFFPLMMN